MKLNRLNILFFILFQFILIVPFSQNIPQQPNPPKLFVDFANLLTPAEQATIEQDLVSFYDSTSNQICVVIIPTLQDYPIEEYANKLFRTWGIGTQKNNGVLLLIASQDKKIRIEVGYGLEGVITDLLSNEIINNDLKPNFKANNYAQGIFQAIQDLKLAANNEYHIKVPNKKKDKTTFKQIVIFFFMILFIVFILSRIGGGGNRGGGSRGSGFGDIATGMLIGSMLSGGSGRSYGGSNWGGGDSGGGFGGFGGGSSGGGGASGSW
ncbi:MAG: TPM domain-containing protein [Alphaproteobacteria bacterium]|nr:TPM domain-containing protein [Alphaproteobacteria bacterium]